MAAPVPLRSDYDAGSLPILAKRSRDPDQTRRRLLALSAIYVGGSRSEADADLPNELIGGKAPGALPQSNADKSGPQPRVRRRSTVLSCTSRAC